MWTDIVEQYQRREGWVSQYADELALVETRRQDVVEAEVHRQCCSFCPGAFHAISRIALHVARTRAPQAMWV